MDIDTLIKDAETPLTDDAILDYLHERWDAGCRMDPETEAYAKFIFGAAVVMLSALLKARGGIILDLETGRPFEPEFDGTRITNLPKDIANRMQGAATLLAIGRGATTPERDVAFIVDDMQVEDDSLTETRSAVLRRAYDHAIRNRRFTLPAGA